MKIAAGIVIICKSSGRILLGKRSDSLSWALFGGTLEESETAYQCVKRELLEETGFVEGREYRIPCTRAAHVKEMFNLKYYTYIGYSENEVNPVLNDEHVQYAWYERGLLPENMHFGVMESIHSMSVHRAIQKFSNKN